MAWIWIPLVLMALNGASFAASTDRTHRDWRSIVVATKDGRIAFRAGSIKTDANNNIIALWVDRYSDSCGSLYMVLSGGPTDVARRSLSKDGFFGAMRVDELPIHNINFHISVEKGSSVFVLTLTNFERESTILEEFERGNRVRFKLTLADVDHYEGFSLLGFTAAVRRTLALCLKNRNKSDRDYFKDQDVRYKSDADYFRQ